MGRVISWFSCGAASAVATKISNPDNIVYCDTGSEDADNSRFMDDCQKWFGRQIEILKNRDYRDTWEVWEKKKYLSGVSGAPCTMELKVRPRLQYENSDDIHVFGYTADATDIKRAQILKENWPQLNIKTPLIDYGLTKASCLSILEDKKIKPPRVYEMGFSNANCIPCVKATSPGYWVLVRKNFPKEFKRMVDLSRKLGVRLARLNGERVYIDAIPENYKEKNPITPTCDILCLLAEKEIL